MQKYSRSDWLMRLGLLQLGMRNSVFDLVILYSQYLQIEKMSSIYKSIIATKQTYVFFLVKPIIFRIGEA